MSLVLSAYNDLGTSTIESELAAPAKAPLLRRVSNWIERKYNRDRDAEIVAFVEERGGMITDAVEREIGSRFGGMSR
jgi:hypothetical protein